MSKRQKIIHTLDRTSRREIRLLKQKNNFILEYCWDHYCYFSQQRSLIIDELKHSLASNCSPFEFKQWQRIVEYKFSLNPLSAIGSLLNYPGGRFNIGDIDLAKFPRFPALYLAEDRETAYKEKFGLNKKEKYSGLTSDDLALTGGNSISILAIGGKLFQVLDLNNSKSLKDFFNLIKDIKLPNRFVHRANKLNINPSLHVKSLTELRNTLLNSNWRAFPMHFDIPSNSQILGQIAHAAGIEAILYPSKMSKSKNCLAIFPENFAMSSSFVEIEDEVPFGIHFKRLDSQSYLSAITPV